MLLPSQSGSSDQPLDLGGFVVGLVTFCGGDSADNCTGDGGVVAFRILFKGLPVNGKEPAHLPSSLWAKPLGLLSVRESRNVSFSLLNANRGSLGDGRAAPRLAWPHARVPTRNLTEYWEVVCVNVQH